MTQTFNKPISSAAPFPLTSEIVFRWLDGIHIWDTSSDTPFQTIEACDSRIRSLAISQDGKQILSRGYIQVQIWQAQAVSLETKQTPESVNLVKFLPDGCHAVSAMNHRLYVWDASTGSLL